MPKILSERGRSDPREEHAEMILCEHTEADQIGPCCLSCGRIKIDPSWCIVGFAVIFIGAQVIDWWYHP